MFVQPVLPIEDEVRFSAVKATLEPLFAPGKVVDFLKQVQRSGLRVRNFEQLLAKGVLGKTTAQAYGGMSDSDRGQTREMYLSLVEQVEPALRGRFLKVYAYY